MGECWSTYGLLGAICSGFVIHMSDYKLPKQQNIPSLT